MRYVLLLGILIVTAPMMAGGCFSSPVRAMTVDEFRNTFLEMQRAFSEAIRAEGEEARDIRHRLIDVTGVKNGRNWRAACDFYTEVRQAVWIMGYFYACHSEWLFGFGLPGDPSYDDIQSFNKRCPGIYRQEKLALRELLDFLFNDVLGPVVEDLRSCQLGLRSRDDKKILSVSEDIQDLRKYAGLDRGR